MLIGMMVYRRTYSYINRDKCVLKLFNNQTILNVIILLREDTDY